MKIGIRPVVAGLEAIAFLALIAGGVGLASIGKPEFSAGSQPGERTVDLYYYPNRSTSVIADWSKDAINDCLTMRGDTLEEDTRACVMSYFDAEGFEDLSKAMNSTNIVSLLENNIVDQPAASSYIVRGPSLVHRYADDDNFYWRFQATVSVAHYFVLRDKQSNIGATLDYVVKMSRATEGRQNGLSFTRFHIKA